MRLVYLSTLLTCFLFLMACNNSPNNTTSTTDKTAPANEKPASVKVLPDLTKYGIANNTGNVLGGLKVGDTAPDFKMLDQAGQAQSLANALKDGPVILVFLRAEWCPYCVKHLQEFQDNIQAIHDTGKATVLAISPQESSYMKDFHSENQLSFPILNDKDHSVMKNYKVFFHVTNEYNEKIVNYKGKKIEVFNGDAEPVMPIPATYLIGQDKTIKYVHYDPDYKKRSDLKEVMAQL